LRIWRLEVTWFC